MVFTQELTSKFGKIWAKRPLVRSNGLICSIANRRHRPKRPRPVFKAVCFSLNGEMVATLDARGHVVVFHLLRNRYEHLRHVGSAGTAIAFSTRRKNELFVSTSDGSVQVFDVASKQLVAVLKGHRHAVSHISLNSTGTLLVTSSVDAAIIWSTGNWTRRRTLGCGAGVLKATFLPSAELLAAAFLDDTVLVWDSVTYEVVARLSLPEREGRVALSCFDLSLDGRYLLAGAKSGSCYLWELRSQTLVRIADMPPQVQAVVDVRFLPDGQMAAVLGDDGHILFVSIAAPQCKSLLDLSVDQRALLCFAIDPAGKYLASAVSDGHLLLHDVEAARRQRAVIRAAQKQMGIPKDELDAVLDTRSAVGRRSRARPTLGPSPHAPAPAAAAGAPASAAGAGAGTVGGHTGNWHQPVGGPASTVNVLPDDGAGTTRTGAAREVSEPPADPIDEPPASSAVTSLGKVRQSILRTGRGDPGVRGHPYFHDPPNGAAPPASTSKGAAASSHAAVPLRPLRPGGATSRARHAWGEPTAPMGGDGEDASAASGAPVRSDLLETVFGDRSTGASSAVPFAVALPRAAAARRGATASHPPTGGGGGGGGGTAATGKPSSGGAAAIRQTKKRLASAQRNARRDAAFPLYKVAELQPQEIQVNQQRLQALLNQFGEYPEKYRMLIWRFLLRLPENHDAFRNLVAKGVHPAFANLHKQFPMEDTRMFRRLRRILSALAFWSPVFGELPYLPALAFPFVKMFARDDLAAFEVLLSIFLNWGRRWVETFPHAPMQVMGRVDALMQFHEPELHRHLRECGVDAQDYAWTLLRSGFTEVLSKSEWLRLWDHLVTDAANPEGILHTVVAYMRFFRTTLLHIAAPKDGDGSARQEIVAFLRLQNAVDLRKLLRMKQRIQRDTPAELESPGEWPGDSTAASASGPPFPVPQGDSYPAFLHFPKFVVNFQLQERDRIAAEEKELSRRTQVMDALRKKTEALEREELAWREERTRLMAAESERRKRAAEAQKRRDRERRRVEAMARERRLLQLQRMQDSTKEAFLKQRAMAKVQADRAEEELQRQMEREEEELKARLDEEALANLEAQAHTRMLELKEERRRQEEEDTFQAELEARRKAAELDQDLMLDQWQTEEAERELQRKLAEEANEARIKADVEDRARRAREAEAMVVALRREKGITKVMRARRLRHLEEDSKHLQHAAQAARDKEAALLAEESKAAMRQLLLQESKQREEESAKRLAVVEEARRQLELEEELRRKRLLQLEQIQNRRLYEEQVIKNRQADLEASKREEEQVQAALAAIEAQRRYAREQELKRLMLEQETKERAAFLREAQEANNATMSEERRKFEAQRKDAMRHARAVEKEMLRAHDANLADQRNAAVGPRDAVWREHPADNGRAGGAAGDPDQAELANALRVAQRYTAADDAAATRRGRGGRLPATASVASAAAGGGGQGVDAVELRRAMHLLLSQRPPSTVDDAPPRSHGRGGASHDSPARTSTSPEQPGSGSSRTTTSTYGSGSGSSRTHTTRSTSGSSRSHPQSGATPSPPPSGSRRTSSTRTSEHSESSYYSEYVQTRGSAGTPSPIAAQYFPRAGASTDASRPDESEPTTHLGDSPNSGHGDSGGAAAQGQHVDELGGGGVSRID